MTKKHSKQYNLLCKIKISPRVNFSRDMHVIISNYILLMTKPFFLRALSLGQSMAKFERHLVEWRINHELYVMVLAKSPDLHINCMLKLF